MEPETIDYKILYEQVTKELEVARLTILKMRYSGRFGLSYSALRSFVYENYLVLVVGIMLLSFVSSNMKSFFSRK